MPVVTQVKFVTFSASRRATFARVDSRRGITQSGYLLLARFKSFSLRDQHDSGSTNGYADHSRLLGGGDKTLRGRHRALRTFNLERDGWLPDMAGRCHSRYMRGFCHLRRTGSFGTVDQFLPG